MPTPPPDDLILQWFDEMPIDEVSVEFGLPLPAKIR